MIRNERKENKKKSKLLHSFHFSIFSYPPLVFFHKIQKAFNQGLAGNQSFGKQKEKKASLLSSSFTLINQSSAIQNKILHNRPFMDPFTQS